MKSNARQKKPEESKRKITDKMTRAGRLSFFTIVSCVCIFIVILLFAVFVNYFSNKNAYEEGLIQQAELLGSQTVANIRNYGKQVSVLAQDQKIVNMFIVKKNNLEITKAIETQIAEEIWKTVGTMGMFYGAGLEDYAGGFYLEDTVIPVFNELVEDNQDIGRDFLNKKFDVSLRNYKNEPLVIISAPVRGNDEKILGYLHVYFNHAIYGFPDIMKNREGFIFNLTDWNVIFMNHFRGLDSIQKMTETSPGFLDNAEKAVASKHTVFTYADAEGKKMVAGLYRDPDFPIAFAVSIHSRDMAVSIIPYALVQMGFSILLMGLLIMILYVFSKRLNRPVSEMIERCGRIADGDENIIFEEQKDKELNRLANAFNRYRAKIEQAAYIDPLLRIGNRAKAFKDIDLKIADYPDREFSVFLIDIQDFSKYNDIFSISNGDKLLQAIALRLSGIFGNQLYRINGDVFLGISPSGWDDEYISRRILKKMGDKVSLQDMKLELKYYMGICSYPAHGKSANELLEKVQSALGYAKKNAVISTIVYNEEITALLRREDEILSLLHRRIADRSLEVWCQPVFEPLTGHYISAEMLLRLKDDYGRYIPPDQVIAIAEKNNEVDAIGDYVLHTACMVVRELDTFQNHIQRLYVNLSVQQLIQPNFAQKAQAKIRDMNIMPSQIGMEVTESMLIQSFDSASEVLKCLREAGVQIALDDFGSGYSSISYLSRLPLDTLKLDMELVKQILQGSEQQELIRTVVQMAKIRHMRVVAEGVEDMETRDKIVSCGADYIQGYYYSKPLPVEDFIRFLKKENSDGK